MRIQEYEIKTAGLSVLNRAAVSVEAQMVEHTKVFPFVGMMSSEDREYEIPVWGPHDFGKGSAEKIAPGGPFPVRRISESTITGTLVKRGLDIAVPFEKISAQGGRRRDQAAQQEGIKATLLEINEVAAALFDPATSVWTTEATASPLFSDSTAEVIEIIRTDLLSVVANTMGGQWPNRLWLNAGIVWDTIAEHPKVRGRINPTASATLQLDQFAALLDLPPGGVQFSRLTSGSSAVYSVDDIWCGFVGESDNEYLPSAIRGLRWTEAGGSENTPYRTRREYAFKGGPAGDDVWIYRTDTWADIIQTAASAGGTLKVL